MMENTASKWQNFCASQTNNVPKLCLHKQLYCRQTRASCHITPKPILITTTLSCTIIVVFLAPCLKHKFDFLCHLVDFQVEMDWKLSKYCFCSWENSINKSFCLKRLEILHPFPDTYKLHWNPKLINYTNLQTVLVSKQDLN